MRAHRKHVRNQKIKQNQRVVAKLVKSSSEASSTHEIPTTVRHQPKLLGLQRTLPLGPSKKSLKRKAKAARAIERIREEIAEMRENNSILQAEKRDNIDDVKMTTASRQNISKSTSSTNEHDSSMQEE
jgi:hypothetical protein